MKNDLTRGQRTNGSFDNRGRLRLDAGAEGRKGEGELLAPVVRPEGSQVAVRWVAQWTAPQRWAKHAGNPLLTDDFSDDAPRSVTSRCFVRHEQGVFQMWYSFAKPGYRICYAESLDRLAVGRFVQLRVRMSSGHPGRSLAL